MKTFLLKLGIFLVFPIIYVTSVAFINLNTISTLETGLEETRVLIAGDSHPGSSLDPSLFEDASNVAMGGEPYIITYWKLRKIFSEFIPDTVIIGLGPHNIAKFNDLKFHHSRWNRSMFRRSYSIGNVLEIDDRVNVDYGTLIHELWMNIGIRPHRNHNTHYIGKFENNNYVGYSSWEKDLNKHFFFEDPEPGISNFAIQSLDSIVKLCQQVKTELVLVSPPVYKDYYNNIPDIIKASYQEVKEKYPDLVIIDHTGTIYPDSMYMNGDHVNLIGAHRFTREVIRIIGNQKNTSITGE